jgi:glucokinase
MPGKSAIGVDIGGTYTKLGLVAADASVSHLARIPTAARQEPLPYLQRLAEQIEALLPQNPAGLGLSLPGLHAPDRRSMVFNPNTPALVGIDFQTYFERFGLPVSIETDLNAPAVAENLLGCGRGSRRFLAATLGTGAGVGVIIAGQALRFSGNNAGDAGHVILEPDGPQCTAGCRGCAEALVTIAAIEREARLHALTSTAKEVIQAARAGDPPAVEIMRLVGRRCGQWLASLAPIFLPDRIALCGGVAEAGLPLLEACRERFYTLAGKNYARCEIVLGDFRELAGVIGAAAPFVV